MPAPSLTRRTLLRSAAGGAALIATRGLPAWARPVARPAALRAPGSLPFPGRPAGTPSMPEIEHFVVLMMENHSFDNLLGMVPHQVPGRRGVDGLHLRPSHQAYDGGRNDGFVTASGDVAMRFWDKHDIPFTYLTPPKLVAAPALGPGLAKCHAAGLTPPIA